jgi:hypothetical protein
MNHGGRGEHGGRNAGVAALTKHNAPGMEEQVTGPEARWNLAGRRQPPGFGVREKSAPEGAEEHASIQITPLRVADPRSDRIRQLSFR